MADIESYRCLVHDTLTYLKRCNSPILFGTSTDRNYFRSDILAITKQKKSTSSQSITYEKKSSSHSISEKVITKKTQLSSIEKIDLVSEKSEVKQASFSHFYSILNEIDPHLEQCKNPLSDELAKTIAKRYQNYIQAKPICMICSRENSSSLSFLKTIAKAIDSILLPIQCISCVSLEKTNRWELFLSNSQRKLIIISETTLQRLPSLLSFYRNIPQENSHFLKEIPLILLKALSLYFKEPLLKRELWTQIKAKVEELRGQT